ncbi:MAG: hypothetical protein K2Y21_11060 [Phycisphaerales bacterium]|nr:hypothetical protein [Phycisphaerales bacterium]
MKFDAKQVLQGVKKHWAIPTLSVVTVAILGTTWWFSESWNHQIKTEAEKSAGDLLSQVNNLKVTYALPTIGTGAAVEQKSEPNAVLTAKYAERKKALLSQGESVVKAAEAFNLAGKVPLVEGLFPEPKPGEQLSKPLDFVAKLVGNPDRGVPSAYAQLLAEVGAGGPVNASALESQLKDIEKREMEKIRGSSPTRELTPTEKDTLQKTLIEARRSEYLRKAGEVRVYADMSLFPGGTAASSTPGSSAPGGFGASVSGGNILLTAPATPLSVPQAFVYQTDYWFLKDLFAVIKNANTGPGGRPAPVRDAVVKRIEKIEMLPWRVQNAATAVASAGGAPVDPNAAAPAVGAESITGFSDSAGANTYDVRRAKLTLVVSSKRLPEFFDAVARTNFMTVTGIAMEKVDGWNELSNGFYYGDENVVRVLVDIETIWLRSWSEPFFPKAVRTALGLPDLPPPVDPNAKPEGQPADGQTPPGGG